MVDSFVVECCTMQAFNNKQPTNILHKHSPKLLQKGFPATEGRVVVVDKKLEGGLACEGRGVLVQEVDVRDTEFQQGKVCVLAVIDQRHRHVARFSLCTCGV